MNAVSEDMRRDWNGPAWDAVEPDASAVGTSVEQPTLVLGGTGKTGRRVAERLAVADFRCGSALVPASHRSTGRIAPPGHRPYPAPGRFI